MGVPETAGAAPPPHPVVESAENEGPQLDKDGAALEAAAALDLDLDLDGPADMDGPPPLSDLARGLVGWDAASDPANPRNFSARKKNYLMVMMGIISTLSPLGSSMVAPGTAATMAELRVASAVTGSFMVSIYLLGYGIGPLFLGPLSEVYGRVPVVVLSTWFFDAWLLGCALAPSMGALVAMRLLAGIGGSGVMTIAPAVVSDLYPVDRRAFAMSLITMAQCVGPAVGPICGGFIAQSLGWRWAYWLLLIVAGATTAGLTAYMPETFAPRILQQKAARLRRQTGKDLHPLLNRRLPARQVLARSIVRPVKLLTCSVMASSLCFYVATIYGFLYIMFTTIPGVFGDQYGWSTSIAGLAYAPLGIGMVLALNLVMATNDAAVARRRKKNNNVYEPEMRLPHVVYYSACIPVSLLWYGWSTQVQAHWMAPLVALTLFGFGLVGVLIPVVTYLVDTFAAFSASAVAANRTALSLLGAFVPLAGAPLYGRLGYGLGNTVLAAVSLAMTPLPVVFYRYGAEIRRRWPVDL